jgi:hypothetical protein
MSAPSLSMPPRHSREHFEALAREPMAFEPYSFGLGILVLASVPYVFLGATAAWLLGA